MGLTERELYPEAVTTAASLHWFAATVKPQHEAAVAEAFKRRDLEAFSPCYQAQTQWTDRRKTLQKPLFPGYVFCRFHSSHKGAVVKTPGVTSIVGFGGVAVPVPEDEVARVRRMVASGLPLQPWPYVQDGDRVCIQRGPLRGLDGIVVRQQKDCCLVVSVAFLRRSVSVHVDRDDLAPISPHRTFA